MDRRLVVCAALAATVAFALMAAVAIGGTSGIDRPSGAKAAKCKGPRELANYLELVNRKLAPVDGDCGAAADLVQTFARRCQEAYAGQGRCKVRSRGRWRCASKLAGPAEKGAPSRVRCRRRGAKARFVLASFPPVDNHVGLGPLGTGGAARGRAVTAAWNPAGPCIDTSAAPTVVPPPNAAVANFEIRLRQAPLAAGQALQSQLLSRGIWQLLADGLGSLPRANPGRTVIILTRGQLPAGAAGVMERTCANPAVDATLVKLDQTALERFETAVHELYHAFSRGLGAAAGTPWQDTWWEEASATWSEGKAGIGEDSAYDIQLQYPNTAIDKFPAPGTPEPDPFPYAISRLIQFLEDRGLVTAGASWPLHPPVIRKYADNPTGALDDQLRARGTNIGQEVAAFWGDRIKDNPAHGLPLRPTAQNSNRIEIEPGTTQIPTSAERLHTKLFAFTLADNVARVEFVFRPPDDGYFWGAVAKDRSQRFRDGESVSFCVERGDEEDLEWPILFPVTFTNGSPVINGDPIEGEIVVHAQRDAQQCGAPTPGNRACELLAGANVAGLFGPGQFPFFTQDSDANMRFWFCVFISSSTEVDLRHVRFRNVPASQVRESVKRQIREMGLRRVNVGDVAGVGTITSDEGPPVDVLTIAIGRENAFLLIGPAGDQERAITLGRRIVGEVE